MNRTMKEILRKEYELDFGGACRIAKKAGYYIDCYDGNGESGMCEPIITFHRKPPHIEEDD